jgi:ribonucleoside-triphosphate reductase
MNTTTDENYDFVDVAHAKWVAHVDRPLGNFNLHFGDKSKLAMCCRYENDLDDMNLAPDSFGNGGVNIGSHRVVTPDYGRAALLARHDIDKFKEIMDDYFDVAAKLLYVHRIDILQKRIEKTPDYLMFFGKLGWFNLDTMFSTFGVVGIYEAVKFLGYEITDDDGTECALDIMAYIKSKVKQYRNEYGFVFNAEEIPGEQACVSLIKKDKIYINPSDVDDDAYDELLNCQLYSNQYIPLVNKADMVTRADLSGRFMKMISGGGIVHLNSEGQIDTDGKMYELMKMVAKSGVPHVAVCYRFGKCERHKASIVGQNTKNCPICGDPIVWTRARVIGYFTDESTWNPVRRKYDAPNRHYSDGKELDEL